MAKKLRIGIDADGIIYDLFRYQIVKGLESFKCVDNEIIIHGLKISEISELEDYADFKYYVIEYINQYCQKYNVEIDYRKYDIQDIFKCSKFRRQIFWLFHIYDYCKNSKAITDVIMYMKKWKAEGKELYNITARVFVTEDNILGNIFRKILLNRYKEEELDFDGIDLCSEHDSPRDKRVAATKRFIDIMLEDKCDNANEIVLNNFTKVFLFDAPYNEFVPKKPNVLTVTSIKKVDELISEHERDLDCELNGKEYVEKNKFKRVKNESELTQNQLLDYYQQRQEYYRNLAYNKDKFGYYATDKIGRKKWKLSRQEKNYKIAYNIMVPTLNFIWGTRVIGKENIPYQDGVIFVSNHRGSWDQFALLKAIDSRPIHFLIHAKLLKMRRGKLYKHVGAIAVDKDSLRSAITSIREMTNAAARCANQFIFPEGTRNRDKDKYLLELADTPAVISKETGVTIIPMAINDEYKLFSSGVIVRVGKPISPQLGQSEKEITNQIEEAFRTMIWENMEDAASIKYIRMKKFSFIIKLLAKWGYDSLQTKMEQYQRASMFNPRYNNIPEENAITSINSTLLELLENEENLTGEDFQQKSKII